MAKLETLDVINSRSHITLTTGFLLPVLLIQTPNSPASEITYGVILGDTEYTYCKVHITPLRQFLNYSSLDIDGFIWKLIIPKILTIATP